MTSCWERMRGERERWLRGRTFHAKVVDLGVIIWVLAFEFVTGKDLTELVTGRSISIEILTISMAKV